MGIIIYLVRHGETTYNAEGRIQGHSDAPLSEVGMRQSRAVAGRLAGERFSAVYSSDLGRARATAEIVSEGRELAVEQTSLLREANLGVLQGLTRTEMDERYPIDLHEWRRNPRTMRPPGAETHEQVIERCRLFLTQTAARHKDGQTLLVVGHGGSLRGLVIAALGLPVETYRRLHFSNAGLSILEVGESPALWLLNDTCHLDSLRTDEEEVDSVAH